MKGGGGTLQVSVNSAQRWLVGGGMFGMIVGVETSDLM